VVNDGALSPIRGIEVLLFCDQLVTDTKSNMIKYRAVFFIFYFNLD